jgi:hypothetical protein
MTWLRGILVGLGIVIVLIVAMVLVFPRSTPPSTSSDQATQTMEVGDRTITVTGHYKELSQESLADGIEITVDGHEITISGDQLTMDDKTQVLDPGEDVTINVDDKGMIDVKLVPDDSTNTGTASQ